MGVVAIDTDLGPFAPDRGAPIPLARAGLALGLAAAAVAGVRPLIEGMSASTHLSWARVAALALAAIALMTSLAAYYVISTRGLRGRRLALTGVALSVAGGLTAIIYGAIADGTLELRFFFNQYFDLHLLRIVAPDLARGALNTIKAAFLAEVIAIALGLIIATFRLSRNPLAHYPAVWFVDGIRGLPIVVLGYLVGFGLPAIGITLSSFAGVVLALVINASAYIAEIFRAGIQSLPRGQMDAARSLGMTQGAAMTSVVIPQAFRAVIPPLMSEFIALIKDTAILFLLFGVTVGTRDIFTAAQQAAASTFKPAPFIGASIGYLIITVPLARIVGRIERRLRVGLA